MRYAAAVEYDGARFCGWQRQLGTATVQGALEAAIARVADQPVSVVAAGRTDSGVHACGQVVHFDASHPRTNRAWQRGTNTLLPPGITVLWAQPVAERFHARFCATERFYRYVILNRRVAPSYLLGRVSWDYRPLDVGRMQRAANALLGRHDFSAYRAAACQASSACRELRSIEVKRSGEWIWLDFRADGFLHHMVRNLVGVLASIGAGEQRPEWAGLVLASRDRRQGGVTAPPDGLYLCGVEYPTEFALPPAPRPCCYWC